MRVLYVSVGSKVSPRTLGSIIMASAVLVILSSRLLLYSAGTGVQVVLPGFRVRLFCFVQVKNVCRYGVCISWLHFCLCM